MEHTEILNDYADIVTIRHRAGQEITDQDMRETLEAITEQYPEKKLLLIEHIYSYSLSFKAMCFLQEVKYFERMASLVVNKDLADHIARSVQWIQFAVPFRVFTESEAALHFLRTGVNSGKEEIKKGG